MTETNNQKKVVVFSTPTCPWCVKAKEYLSENSIPFKDVDVSQDHVAAQQMILKSGQMGVPQLWIDDAVIVGFNKNAIDELLAL